MSGRERGNSVRPDGSEGLLRMIGAGLLNCRGSGASHHDGHDGSSVSGESSPPKSPAVAMTSALAKEGRAAGFSGVAGVSACVTPATLRGPSGANPQSPWAAAIRRLGPRGPLSQNHPMARKERSRASVIFRPWTQDADAVVPEEVRLVQPEPVYLLPAAPAYPRVFAPWNATFARRQSLLEPGRWKSKKQRPKRFQCPHCKVSFSNNGQLKGHIRIHTGTYGSFLTIC